MNGRPLTTRKKIQILIAFTILTWATHTLLHQWGYGAEIPGLTPGAVPSSIGANVPVSVEIDPAEEKFVPGGNAVGGTLELRGEATVYGGEVRLKQVCRWSEPDAATFVPVADLVVLRIDEKTTFKPITLTDLRATLRDAGVNLGSLRFAGPTVCTVRRSDAHGGDATLTMEQWIEARRGQTAAEATDSPQTASKQSARQEIAVPVNMSVTSEPIAAAARLPATRPAVAANSSPLRSLRALLLNDLSIRVGMPVEQLQVSFNPSNDNVLNLSEPQFRFNLEARRVRDLGLVEWEVTVVAGGGERKTEIVATARAWQTQVVTDKPLSYHQLIRPTDVSERRTLIDHMSDEPVLTVAECVGQQAARDLKPETILTARMVDPVPLAKPGQLITVNANQGNIHIRTVARATEGGSFGQTIRVKNDITNESYDVVLTGPQEGLIGEPADAARLVFGRRTGE